MLNRHKISYCHSMNMGGSGGQGGEVLLLSLFSGVFPESQNTEKDRNSFLI